MKTNEAPEKLYISDSELNDAEHCVIWFKSQYNENDIEYTRTDAFIEKACEYFAPHIKDNSGGYDRAFVLEGFKKYMKGEK